MSKIVIDVNPLCIDWVIEAYPKIKETINDIEKWKTKKPTLNKVKGLSHEIKRPIAFFLSNPRINPKTLGGIDKLDTRTVQSEKIDINYKVVVLSEELQKRRKDYIQIATLLGIDIMPKFTVFKEQDKISIIECIANFIYPSKTQLISLNPKKVYSYVVGKIEELNILVFKVPQKDKSLRGLALYNDILPIIGITSSDAVVGQIFSVIHELAHILLKSSMIHNIDTNKYEFTDIEKLCNEITGKVLLQDAAMYDDPVITKLTYQQINLGHIEEIANNYRVSRDVALRRLLDGKLINKTAYNDLAFLLKEKQKTETNKPSGGGRDMHLYTTINQLGMKYCKAIYKGWESGLIPKNDLHYYLGRKDKYCIEIMGHLGSKLNK